MKKILVFLSMIFVFSTFTIVTAENEIISADEFSQNQIAELTKEGFSESEILSISRQIKMNDLSELQIKNYISSKIKNKAEYKQSDYAPVNYPKTVYGDSITPYGVIPTRKKYNTITSQIQRSNINEITDVIDEDDNTGVYYIVESDAGYDEMTSYVSLPVLSNIHSDDRPYQMFGVNSATSTGSMWGDIGLVYFPGVGWKGFYNVYETIYDQNSPGGKIENHNENYGFSFTGSSNLYFHLMISDEYMIMDIINPVTWQTVCYISYSFRSACVPENMSTVKISKQVTMAQHLNGEQYLDIDSGSVMTGAAFWDTHLYLSTYYDYSFTSQYCGRAIRKGPSQDAYETITYTNIPWTQDNVTITFNQ